MDTLSLKKMIDEQGYYIFKQALSSEEVQDLRKATEKKENKKYLDEKEETLMKKGSLK